MVPNGFTNLFTRKLIQIHFRRKSRDLQFLLESAWKKTMKKNPRNYKK